MLTNTQSAEQVWSAVAPQYQTHETLDNHCGPATVYVVEDDQIVSDVLCRLLQSAGFIAVAYVSARAFLKGYQADRPGCILLDVGMPEMSGMELHHAIASQGMRPAVIYLTGYGDIATATQAMRNGAVDFIEKPFEPKVLLARVQEAIERDRLFRRTNSRVQLLKKWLAQLTEREREVMELLAQGQSTKAIASSLTISPKTVDNHRKKVLEKMHVDNSTELANLLFLRRGENTYAAGAR